MEDDLRQRVLSTTNLLLNAVDRLEGVGVTESRNGPSTSAMVHNSSGVIARPTPRSTTHAACSPSTSLGTSTSSSTMHGPSSINFSRSTPRTNTGTTCSPSTSLPGNNTNVHAELSHLFNWNSCLGKRSGKSRRVVQSSSKKKKLKTWTHTFVCLASTSCKWIPDTNDRTMLKLAGLGEKKFSVFAYDTSCELQDELIREYPKLGGAGGYELLRASENGSRELVLIEMPRDGYSVEYLQAIVKSAKIYIRPLQRNLDTSPIVKEVS